MIDLDKCEGRLADALICVREGGVDDDYSKIRLEDALDDMKDLIYEFRKLQFIVDSIPDDVWDQMKTWEAMEGVIGDEEE